MNHIFARIEALMTGLDGMLRLELLHRLHFVSVRIHLLGVGWPCSRLCSGCKMPSVRTAGMVCKSPRFGDLPPLLRQRGSFGHCCDSRLTMKNIALIGAFKC
jgi:hypothetical protein